MSVETKVYVALSLVWFFEFAAWGAWAPVLAGRLMGPLKMTGKQTGWIYATLPLACIVAPFISGYLADKYWNIEWVLAGCHVAAVILMFIAVRQKSFSGLFITMLAWSFFFSATLPLVSSVVFINVKTYSKITPPSVFIWAPVAWALAGYALTGWRMRRKEESDGTDALIFSALLSLAMVASCFLLPATPPVHTVAGEQIHEPLKETFAMLKQPNFCLFVIASMVVAGVMQFYFIGTGSYMIARGISGKIVPGAMAMAQAAQALATYYLLNKFSDEYGYKWLFTGGACCWLLLYAIYVARAPRALVFVAQALHGLAYVFFIIGGQIYVNNVAPSSIASSAQALFFSATTGVGLFLNTQLAGYSMDKFTVDGKVQWSKFWAVPLGITAAGVIAFAFFFRDDSPKKVVPAPAPEVAMFEHSAR